VASSALHCKPSIVGGVEKRMRHHSSDSTSYHSPPPCGALVNIDNAHIRNRREPPTTSATPARRRVNFNVRNLILHSGRVIVTIPATIRLMMMIRVPTRRLLLRRHHHGPRHAITSPCNSYTDDKSDNKLTVHQVKQVLAFLQSNFPPDLPVSFCKHRLRILRKNSASCSPRRNF
jgi:hypothetical protein